MHESPGDPMPVSLAGRAWAGGLRGVCLGHRGPSLADRSWQQWFPSLDARCSVWGGPPGLCCKQKEVSAREAGVATAGSLAPVSVTAA